MTVMTLPHCVDELVVSPSIEEAAIVRFLSSRHRFHELYEG